MPIFMDRHDVSENVTAEIVADLHQRDLQIEHKFNCKGLTYWFDAKRKTAFCLVEAPNREAIQKMHDFAHGEVAHRIIEVDRAVVESFLGRIEDPEKSQKTELNIINDPAFRTIMIIRVLKKLYSNKRDNLNLFILQSLKDHKGRLVKQKINYFLTSFDSVTNAVLCALDIQQKMDVTPNSTFTTDSFLKIGLSAGIPVSNKEGIFEDTIQMADRLCRVVIEPITISSEVKDLFESENFNIALDNLSIGVLPFKDRIFFSNFMDFVDKEWNNPQLNTDAFISHLGCSKSHLYRKITSLNCYSLNHFLKQYRLNQALELLHERDKNISEIAFETGFNSPAYFSKCFQEVFNILPSNYSQR